jgi:putative membrane protein
MKKINLSFAICVAAAMLCSCGSNTSTTTESSDSPRNTNMNSDTGTAINNTPAAGPAVTTPLSKEDSAFVMKAAVGGMMEVEAGKLAQQKGSNDRVKNFGAMMERDHSKANSELSSMVSGRGIVLPTALPADEQKHLDAMGKMTGKAFDNHYVNMMVSDHAKDIDEFKKQVSKGADAQLKNWVSNTLPTLQVHKDSIDAIKKMKM